MRYSLWLSLLFICLGVSGVAKADGSLGKEAPIQLAQLSIELGGSADQVRRSLRRAGYSEIRITKNGFSSIRAEACYEGSRYAIKVKRFTGEVDRGRKIGECRPALSEARIVRILTRKGYRRASVYGFDGAVYRAVACRRGDRYRMELSRYGDVISEDRVGSCVDKLNLAEVRQRLRDQGFNRIKLVEERDRRFIVEACEGTRKYRLAVRKRNASVARKRRIDRCLPPLTANAIPGLMEKAGFDRINMVDRKLPVYIAEGCRSNDLVRVQFNRFGRVLNETQIGECDPPLTEAEIVDLIRKKGGRGIRVEVDRNGNFTASSCYKSQLYTSRFDKWGKLFDQRYRGKCPPSPRLRAVVDRFEDRDLKDATVFIEGCRRGRRIRIELDEFGERVSRERVGNC